MSTLRHLRHLAECLLSIGLGILAALAVCHISGTLADGASAGMSFPAMMRAAISR